MDFNRIKEILGNTDYIKSIGDKLCGNYKNNCETFGLTILKDGTVNAVLFTDKVDPSKLEDLPNDTAFSIIYSKNKLATSPSTESKLSGKCANVTLKSKDIGKDCFGQLWAENKCSNPIPEYSDTFKALSYEEIAKEVKDSNCYTNKDWKKTSYRFVRDETLKSTTEPTKLAEKTS